MNFIPYHDDVKGAPQNSIIGGATLWVMSGKKPADYKGVAKFFAYLSKPAVQMDWHTATGYVPITMAAYEMTRKSGFYDKNPGADMAVKQLTNKPPTANSKGLRFGNFVQGREVIEEEMEAVFAGKKDAKTALDEAVKRGNEILRKFEAANKYERRGALPSLLQILPEPRDLGAGSRWKSASYSDRPGCRMRCSRRRSRSRWCSSSGRRSRRCGFRSSCRTRSA